MKQDSKFCLTPELFCVFFIYSKLFFIRSEKTGKNQKTELGRALVKQHSQIIQQTKEQGRIYEKKFLDSFTEVSDIDAII
jgi:ATP-dependent RNA circularization protein (DNA/RNA ligase family)